MVPVDLLCDDRVSAARAASETRVFANYMSRKAYLSGFYETAVEIKGVLRFFYY
jgi:hypothetical protein